MRIFACFVLLLTVTACADSATMFAGGVRGWCKSSPNCNVQD